MELGFHVPIFDIDGGTTAIAGELARVGAAAEESGATWLSFMDHFFQIEPTGLPAESNMLEGYTTLGYLAAHTSTVDLGLLVTGVTYRHPGLLAKIVTTLDVLSGGRAVLGIGAAWFEREHRGLGVPFPPVAQRFERLEETLQHLRPDVGPAQQRAVRGQALPAGGDALLTPADQSAQGPHRRQRGAKDAAACRAVRRRVQSAQRIARGGRTQARRVATALRRRWSGLRRDPQDNSRQQAPRHTREPRRIRAPYGRLRQGRSARPPS